MESMLPCVWVPAESRLLASLTSGAGMTKRESASLVANSEGSIQTPPTYIDWKPPQYTRALGWM
jgi:hypothetical protein